MKKTGSFSGVWFTGLFFISGEWRCWWVVIWGRVFNELNNYECECGAK